VGSSPSITVTGTLQSFSTCAGTPSAAQSLTVGGSNLGGDVTVNAPSGYEVSLSSGSGYASSLVLPRSGTSVSATIIYIRLRADASNGAAGSLSVTSAGATSQSVAVGPATVHAQPTTSAAGVDQSKCGNGSFTMSANTPAVGTGQWSVVIGTATIATPTAPNTAVTGVPAGGRATLRWTVSNGSCPTSTDDVELIHQSNPVITVTPASPSIAYGGSVTLTASGASTYSWSPPTGLNVTTGASVQSTLTSSTTYTVTGRDANGCEGTATVTVTVGSSPSLTVTGTLQSFSTCAGTPSAAQSLTVGGSNLGGDVTVNAPSGYEVSLSSGSGYASSLVLPRSGTSVSATIIYIRLRADATNGTAGSLSVTSAGATSQSVAVGPATVHAQPTTSLAGVDQSKCGNGSFTMSANAPAVGTGQWSVVSGTATIATPTAPNTAVTGVPAGGHSTLRWTVSNGSCTASTDEVELVLQRLRPVSISSIVPMETSCWLVTNLLWATVVGRWSAELPP
jgi:large repetitive protein